MAPALDACDRRPIRPLPHALGLTLSLEIELHP